MALSRCYNSLQSVAQPSCTHQFFVQYWKSVTANGLELNPVNKYIMIKQIPRQPDFRHSAARPVRAVPKPPHTT